MQATFLGTADGHTSPSRPHSAILIESVQGSILLECGAPVANYLAHAEVDPDKPDVVWISHTHSDHLGSFPMLVQSLWLRKRSAPLQVCAPSAAIPMLQTYLVGCLLFPELIGFAIEWIPLKGRKKVGLQGGAVLTSFPTKHLDSLAKFFRKSYPGTSFDCFGAVLELENKRVLHTADIARPEELVPLLQKQEFDAVISEFTHFPEEDLFRVLAPFPVPHLLLTHYPDRMIGKESAFKKLAKGQGFNGRITLAIEGLQVKL